MKCPHCSKDINKVNNSRSTKKNTQIWRRRECLECGNLFTTYERVNLSYLTVVKKGGRTERFRYTKLFAGIFLASVSLKNADKGDSAIFAESIAQLVQQKILTLKTKRVRSAQIREIILEVLLQKDQQVFLHYLAYVKKFPTKSSLISEFEKIK